MSGTYEGGLKTATTNKLKHGSDYYANIGRIGGSNGTGHAFAHGKIDPSTAGKLGGRPKKSFTTSQSASLSPSVGTAMATTSISRARVHREFQEGFNAPSWKDKILRRSKI